MRVPATSGFTAALCLAIAVASGVLALTGGDAFAQPGAVGEATGAISDTTAAIPVACDVAACDVPDDAGGQLLVTWGVSTEEPKGPPILGYQVLRYTAGEEPCVVGEVPATEREYTDTNSLEDGTPYQYIVRTVTAAGTQDSDACPPAVAAAQWFSRSRLSTFVVGFLFCAAVLAYIAIARKGTELYIRKIPGLDAVDDAVGRATEMGRPVLYVPGIETVSEIGTLAALTILGHVAKKVAQHGTPLIVPCSDAIVMTTAQEIVKQAYTEVGQADLYDPSNISYLTYDQFGYTAGVDGIMLRERPEAVFLMGYFAAESLILAETGYEIGAIQISGTKETSQLPFFVAACDYTLIGEELFAASSYLSHEPVMLGSLKAQDQGKLWIVALLVVMIVLGSIGYAATPDGSSALCRVFDAVRGFFASSA